jgi:anti-sigma-K factor RskA
MDIKAYIESGILESYALGLCNEQEAREVETLCLHYPEVKDELDKISHAVNDYASLHAKAPAPTVKRQVFEAIDRLTAQSPATGTTFTVLALKRYRFAVAASVALFVLSMVGNIIIYTKYKAASEQVISLNAEKNQLAEQMKTNQVKMDQMHNDMAILSNPVVAKVMMKGVEKSPESMAMVYWNKESKEVFIEVKKLPMPAPGKQYQLWAIVDGKPVDAGMITMTEGDSALHKMKDFNTAQAFAITLEKEGGSPVPTLSEMYVMGQVSL